METWIRHNPNFVNPVDDPSKMDATLQHLEERMLSQSHLLLRFSLTVANKYQKNEFFVCSVSTHFGAQLVMLGLVVSTAFKAEASSVHVGNEMT
jgi:hypothetical protein